MSIDTTIEYVTPVGTSAVVQGSPVPLSQDANGFILHNGKQVRIIMSKISGGDSDVVFQVTPTGTHTVIVEKVTITCPQVLSQSDLGGVKWSAAGSGQDITITAPAFVGGTRDYVFSEANQPPVKLKVTVIRT